MNSSSNNKTTIACFHTAASNITLFEAEATRQGLALGQLRHHVRADLLTAAEAAGGLTPALIDVTCHALAEVAQEATVVILTCSTLGPALTAVHLKVPVLAADRTLAAQAAAAPGPLAVLYAAPTSRDVSRHVFTTACQGMGPTPKMIGVTDAWPLFRAGEMSAYEKLIAAAADRAFSTGVATVALAQTSMSGAARLCRLGQPLTIPAAALDAALALSR